MNEPVETLISDQDIINEYEKTKDKKGYCKALLYKSCRCDSNRKKKE